MNRNAILASAAIATLIGCAEDAPGMSTDALAVYGAMGITPTLELVPMSGEFSPPEDGGLSNSIWEAADVEAGSYWMTIEHVAAVEGNADASAGSRELTFVSSDQGMPMLLGIAPLMASGENVSAQYVDVYTAPYADGRCQVTTILTADGVQTGPESLEMFVYMEDTVEGEDCFKLGFGEEKSDIAAFDATFDYIPPVVDGSADNEGPTDPGNI